MSIQQLLTLLLVAWNIVVFVTYGVDKGKARKHLYRIPEKVLLTQAILFAGIGAAWAGYFFHHKTRKWYFKACWLLGSVLEVVLLYWIWRIS